MSGSRVALSAAVSCVALLGAGWVPAATAAVVDNHLSLVSVADPEVFPGNGSFNQAMSDDGRYVVFTSFQQIVQVGEPGDPSRAFVYVRDLVAGTTTRLSQGTESYWRGNAAISGDGRYVVYPSLEGTTNLARLRLYDQQSGKYRVIRSSSSPSPFGIDAYTAGISDNGRTVVFTEAKTADGLTYETRLYRYDMASRVTTLLVPDPIGGPTAGVGTATVPSLSADGRFVSYVRSTTPGINAPETTSPYQLVRLDTATAQASVISTSTPQYNPASAFGNPSLSNTGRFLAYHDRDAAGVQQAYLYDATDGTSALVSHTPTGQAAGVQEIEPRVSGDGRSVAFVSAATDILPGMPAVATVYLWDRRTDTFEAIVRNRQGAYPTRANARSTTPAMGRDGSKVTFTSVAQDLVAGADDRLGRVYLWQR